MRLKGAVTTLMVGVLVLGLSVTAHAQLAKEGTYTSHFGWYASGKTLDLEKDHTLFLGEYNGTNFNDDGKGFLHHTSVVCPGMAETVKKVTNAHGNCVVTDKDGDKVFLVWKCKDPGSGCKGDFQWTGGTGKYTGITGNNTFTGFGITPTASGYALWKGEWKLP